MKQDEHPDKYQPITDRATAEILKWSSQPENIQDIRTSSQINKDIVFPLSSILPINNRRKQLTKSKLIINNLTEEEFGAKFPDGLPLGNIPIITYKLDNESRDQPTEELEEHILTLSNSTFPSPRANLHIDMIKNKNRPAFNPMAMMGGMFGNKSETPIEEEDDYPTTID